MKVQRDRYVCILILHLITIGDTKQLLSIFFNLFRQNLLYILTKQAIQSIIIVVFVCVCCQNITDIIQNMTKNENVQDYKMLEYHGKYTARSKLRMSWTAFLGQHRTISGCRLCRTSACIFSVILSQNSLKCTSIPASFWYNLTAHLYGNNCSVLP